ncbi:MAG: DNA polymerase III subunit delta' [Mariprofundales bacterium]|nr:DNA polymerase III subunit delta' [Mariprofundales bacterium]
MKLPVIHGHNALRRELLHAITAPQHHHAWLLHGPRGVGKSLLAHEMAQAALCLTSSPHPCMNCHSCTMIAADSHPDLLLLKREEGRRDISIAQVRHMLNFVALTSYEGGMRIVIIDDAERMNGAAANALLKGLEEPAAGAVIIMVCGDLHQLPATIRSRCRVQTCRALDERSTYAVLHQIGVAESALDMATKLAQGRPGRAAALCDEQWREHLQRWQELTTDLSDIDIGEMQQLLASKWSPQPLSLAVTMILEKIKPQLAHYPFAIADRLLEICQRLAEAPARIEQQSLRCDQAILGPVIELRGVLAQQSSHATSTPG